MRSSNLLVDNGWGDLFKGVLILLDSLPFLYVKISHENGKIIFNILENMLYWRVHNFERFWNFTFFILHTFMYRKYTRSLLVFAFHLLISNFVSFLNLTLSEPVAWRRSVKKVLLNIWQNSQKNTCAKVSFLIKRLYQRCFLMSFAKLLTPSGLQNLLQMAIID